MLVFVIFLCKKYCDVIMNNDRPPASKLRNWLMGNKESTLPGLIIKLLVIIGLKDKEKTFSMAYPLLATQAFEAFPSQ